MSPPDAWWAISEAAARLVHSDTPRLDAELLMAHALGIEREALLLGGLDRPVPDQFEQLVARRIAGEPMAYIVGHRDFWTIRLAVAPGVLIPRPDSETLIEAAVTHFTDTKGPKRVLDLGTGSGALLLAALAEWPEATGVGIDQSPAALAIAQANAETLGMADRARMIEGGWDGTGETFDLILCNPPYIATAEPLPRDVADHEPHSALFAGADGLDDYRALAPLLPAQLAPGGVACIEIGATQAPAVASFMASQGLVVHIRRDLAGLDRCIVATHRQTAFLTWFCRSGALHVFQERGPVSIGTCVSNAVAPCRNRWTVALTGSDVGTERRSGAPAERRSGLDGTSVSPGGPGRAGRMCDRQEW